MNDAAATAADSVLPPPPRTPKQCQCGAVYTHAEWEELPNRRFLTADRITYELRDCRCGVSIDVEVPR